MRISGGDARGIKLKVPKGARPVSEKVRQAVFSSIAAHVPDARVLDLFCGSGAYGLEALSRGAAHVVFVDRDLAATKATRDNMCAAGMPDDGKIRRTDVVRYLGSTARSDGPFDLIFADPPYEDGLEPTLAAIAPLLGPGGRAVVETRYRAGEAVPHPGLVVEADRRYGDTRVLVYSPSEGSG